MSRIAKVVTLSALAQWTARAESAGQVAALIAGKETRADAEKALRAGGAELIHFGGEGTGVTLLHYTMNGHHDYMVFRTTADPAYRPDAARFITIANHLKKFAAETAEDTDAERTVKYREQFNKYRIEGA
jgi:hypothetical protein